MDLITESDKAVRAVHSCKCWFYTEMILIAIIIIIIISIIIIIIPPVFNYIIFIIIIIKNSKSDRIGSITESLSVIIVVFDIKIARPVNVRR